MDNLKKHWPVIAICSAYFAISLWLSCPYTFCPNDDIYCFRVFNGELPIRFQYLLSDLWVRFVVRAFVSSQSCLAVSSAICNTASLAGIWFIMLKQGKSPALMASAWFAVSCWPLKYCMTWSYCCFPTALLVWAAYFAVNQRLIWTTVMLLAATLSSISTAPIALALGLTALWKTTWKQAAVSAVLVALTAFVVWRNDWWASEKPYLAESHGYLAEAGKLHSSFLWCLIYYSVFMVIAFAWSLFSPIGWRWRFVVLFHAVWLAASPHIALGRAYFYAFPFCCLAICSVGPSIWEWAKQASLLLLAGSLLEGIHHTSLHYMARVAPVRFVAGRKIACISSDPHGFLFVQWLTNRAEPTTLKKDLAIIIGPTGVNSGKSVYWGGNLSDFNLPRSVEEMAMLERAKVDYFPCLGFDPRECFENQKTQWQLLHDQVPKDGKVAVLTWP